MKNLISMTDFILEKNKAEEVNRQSYIECRNYANFLKQSLELWMFVPCDENGNIMPEPYELFTCDCDEFDEYTINYCKAKERVIFYGFEVDYDRIVKNNEIRIQFNDFSIYLNNSKNVISIIEDLVKHNLQLTK